MAKFSDVAKGSYARREISVDLNGSSVVLDVRVLTPDEEADVIASAVKYAQEHGIEKPTEDDPVYEIGVWIYTALAACVDHDSPQDAPRPFFANVQEITGSRVLTRTHLAYLCEHQGAWQSECSPYERAMTNEQLMARTRTIAEGDIRPFVALPPFMRWHYVRGLAARLVTLLAEKSHSGSPSPIPEEEDEVPTDDELVPQ